MVLATGQNSPTLAVKDSYGLLVGSMRTDFHATEVVLCRNEVVHIHMRPGASGSYVS